MSMHMAADFMLQQMLLKMSEPNLDKSILERKIMYNGKSIDAIEFKKIIKDNLTSKYVQTLNELFGGNVE
jgi:hypothetical protein